MDEKIRKNSLGYFEVAVKPDPAELKAYYAEKYYQTAQGSYETVYTSEEKDYFGNKIEQKLIATYPYLTLPSNFDEKPRFLDVGAGEGWALSHLTAKGWECLGLDYSDHGCRSQNLHVAEKLMVGDIYDQLDKLVDQRKKFHLILLDNVLEHVIDPLALLNQLSRLLEDGGCLVVEVPNDFSKLQQHLIEEECVESEYWVALPDHLSYFSPEGLESLAKAAGWSVKSMMTDYPIELFLLNEHANYVKDRSVGKAAHSARVAAENFFHKISPEKTVVLYQSLAELGIGRTITAVMSRD